MSAIIRCGGLLGLSLAALVLASPLTAPAQAQSRDRTEVHRLEPLLQRRIIAALRREGLELGRDTVLFLSTEDCPALCNDGVVQGACFCIVDPGPGHCPDGTDPGPVVGLPDRDPQSGGRICVTPPDHGRLIGTGMPDHRLPLR